MEKDCNTCKHSKRNNTTNDWCNEPCLYTDPDDFSGWEAAVRKVSKKDLLEKLLSIETRVSLLYLDKTLNAENAVFLYDRIEEIESMITGE